MSTLFFRFYTFSSLVPSKSFSPHLFLDALAHSMYYSNVLNNIIMSKKNRSAKRADKEKSESVQGSKDKSPYVHQDGKLSRPLDIRERYPLSEKLRVIHEVAMDKQSKVIMINGFWGTAKSSTAVLIALKLMNEKKTSGIVYIRNPLESTASGKVGLLPGSLEERMAPYNAILFDKLNEFLPKCDIDRLKNEGRLECIPVSFLQGKTFNCKTVIIDEAASMSYDDLLLAISRIGHYCKVFVIGDSTFQLTIGARSGFRRFFNYFDDNESKENGIYTFELKEEADIVRSGLIRFVMTKTGIIPHSSPTLTSDWSPSGNNEN